MELLTAERANGGWYSAYTRYPFFSRRSIMARAQGSGVYLVAGCGFGYLVDDLFANGVNVWGIDASAYAISQGQIENPAVAGRLLQRSVLVDSDLVAARQAAGLRTTGPQAQRQRFDICLTEDLLPCLTDAEITTALTVLRANCNKVAHIITFLDPIGQQVPEMNWKTLEQWRAILGNDFIYGPNGEGPL